jgi:hypothetical protein
VPSKNHPRPDRTDSAADTPEARTGTDTAEASPAAESDQAKAPPTQARGTGAGVRPTYPSADAYTASLFQLGVDTNRCWYHAARVFAEKVRMAQARAVAEVPDSLYQQMARAQATQDPTILAPAYSTYLDTVQHVYTDTNQVYGDALRDYLQEVEDVWVEAQHGAAAEYAQFIKDVRAALSKLEEDPVDPAAMALIGWTLLASARPTAAFVAS